MDNLDTSKVLYTEEFIDIDSKICKSCGSTLVFNKDEIVYKVEVIPSKIKVIKYIIKKYKCNNCSESIIDNQINIFDNESFLTPSLASTIINYKYNYALPLYRIEAIFKEMGVELSRTSLANYCIKTSIELEVIYDRLKELLINTSLKILHADETTNKVLEVSRNSNRDKSYTWVYSTGDYDKNRIYIYEHQETRERINPVNFLKGYKGYLICDDYKAYENIEGVKLSRCWFHAKKKYADLIKTLTESQKKKSKAVLIHNKISNIFFEENKIQNSNLNPEEIKNKRLEILKPLVDDYFKYIKDLYNEEGFDKESVLGKSINYSLKIEDDLCRFFEDGHIPLTNNLKERAVKPFVILRKNALFSESINGAKASAILFSIVQTAKQNLIKPDEYIKWVLDELIKTNHSKIVNLLPLYHNEHIPEECKYKNIDLDLFFQIYIFISMIGNLRLLKKDLEYNF